MLAPLLHRLLEKTKYLPKENKAIHLVFAFSPVKECSGPWKSNKDAAELPAELSFPMPEMTDQATLHGAGVLKPNNMKHIRNLVHKTLP